MQVSTSRHTNNSFPFLLTTFLYRELKHWNVVHPYIYVGSIILHHKKLQYFQITIDFKPEEKEVEKNLDSYGKILFHHLIAGVRDKWDSSLNPFDKLCLQSIFAKLPTNLLSFCPSSSDLSQFDEQMNDIIMNELVKCRKLMAEIIKSTATLEMDDE